MVFEKVLQNIKLYVLNVALSLRRFSLRKHAVFYYATLAAVT